MSDTPIEIGWSLQANTGWGLFAMHLALGLARQGRRVYVPPGPLAGIPATLQPTIQAMMDAGDRAEHRIRFDPYGNHAPGMTVVPNRTRVLLAVFEDPAAAIPEKFAPYDLVLAPSMWVHTLLESKGVASTLWHQGFDESLFYPAPKRRSDDRFYVFSGGKLEFRKGQDIVVETFKRFRETPEGKDAVLVTAWQNAWPATMEGIWSSGYVKGIPAMRNGALDIVSWLEANGIPRSASIDLGMLGQADLANAIRECDVGIFPNRCEGATNMALTECLGLGVPTLAGNWCGQADIAGHGLPLDGAAPVVLPCKLYQSTEGWREADVDACLSALQWVRGNPPPHPGIIGSAAGENFGWEGAAAHMTGILADQ